MYARYFNGYMFCVAFFSVALAALSRDVVRVMADSGIGAQGDSAGGDPGDS